MKLETITEDWLKEVGFKWHQLERQSSKHWLLWLGWAARTDYEDLGIEIASGALDDKWFCWLRSDAAGRYHRFIHLRHIRTCADLIGIIEGITGQAWDPANNRYGAMRSPEDAARIRAEDDRLDRRLREKGHPWYEIERDETRGGALPEHLEAHEKAKGA